MNASKCRAGLLVSAVSWLALGAAAYAEDPQSETIIVTGQRQTDAATKTDAPLTEAPQAITVISREDMDARSVDTVAEAVRYSAGVSADYYGPDGRGFEWIQLRGFSTFDSTYRDGMRLFNFGFSEAYGLDSVEVVRGPSSVLYGQSPPGGLVNSVSKTPSFDQRGEVGLDVGNRHSTQATFDVDSPLTQDGSVAGRLVGLYRDADLQFTYPDGGAVSNDRRYIAGSLTWRLDADTRLTVLGDYMTQKGGFGWYAPTPDDTPTRVLMTDHGWDFDDIYGWDAGYLFEHDLSSNLTFRSRLRYTLLDDDGRDLSDNGFNTPAQPTLLDRISQRFHSHSQSWASDNMLEAKFDTFGLHHDLIAGVDYARGTISNFYQSGDAPPLDVAAPVYGQTVPAFNSVDLDERIDFEQLGFYLQDQIKWKAWILTAGLRHDRATSRDADTVSATLSNVDDSAVSGRVGLGYVMGNGLTPYISYSQSFMPNVGSDVNNNAFEPTRGEQLEAGVKYQMANGFLLTATAFVLDQENVLTDDINNPGFSVARGQARSKGVELEASGPLTSELSLDASYTYNPVEVTRSTFGDEGNRFALAPLNAATLWLDYSPHAGMLSGFTFGGGVRYLGKTFTDTFNTRTNPAQTLVDLSASYDFPHWRISLDAENLFDDTIFINDGFSYYYETERRTVSLRARYKW